MPDDMKGFAILIILICMFLVVRGIGLGSWQGRDD